MDVQYCCTYCRRVCDFAVCDLHQGLMREVMGRGGDGSVGTVLYCIWLTIGGEFIR